MRRTCMRSAPFVSKSCSVWKCHNLALREVGGKLFEGCILLSGDKSLSRRQLHWFHSYSSPRSLLIQGIELQQSFQITEVRSKNVCATSIFCDQTDLSFYLIETFH